jgi:hypothetical protein
MSKLTKLSPEQVKRLQDKQIDRFLHLLDAYQDELNITPVKGQYNKVFGTYGKSQRDVKKEWKDRIDSCIGIMKYLKIDTDNLVKLSPEIEEDMSSPLGDV